MNFGEKLKEIRAKQGLSQEKLAEKIGVSRQAITKWETNRGLPDVENMIILAEIFKVTLDELIMQRTEEDKEEENKYYESETVYDIDCYKHFDIRVGSVRKITVTSCDDEKVHVKLQSEVLQKLNTMYKVKIDEKKNRLDILCENKKDISQFEAEKSLDVVILLPGTLTKHCEIQASAKELVVRNIDLERLEYDGAADMVYIKDVNGSVELTGKTDYEIRMEGTCSQLDINQWSGKSLVHVKDLSRYRVINKGRKSKVVFVKDGAVQENVSYTQGENVISNSGIRSELVVSECKK